MLLGNNKTFDGKIVLLRIIVYDDMLEKHTEIINGKWKDNNFVMNSMKQMNNIFQDHVRIIL